MEIFAPLISNLYFIWFVVAVLVLFAVFSALSLRRGTNAAVRQLDILSTKIGQTTDALTFAQQFETLNETMSSNELIGNRWREFNKSLVLPSRPNQMVRCTLRPANWFDASLLRSKKIGIDLRYHAALPNMLVGAGLLVTFLGLAVALATAGGVVEGNAATRNVALKQLLDAASFKFVTSLVGLLLSILYTFFHKHRLWVVERALDRFNEALEDRMPLLTPASLQQDANQLLDDQSTKLEAFSNTLATNMAQAFDQAFDRRLGDHIGPLALAIEKLSERLASNNEEGMKSMLDAFLSRLQGGAGDRMQDVAVSLGSLGTRLEGVQTGLGDAALRLAQSADSMAARMGEGAEAALSRITGQLTGLADSLRGVADTTRNAGAEAGRQLAQRIETAAAGFEESSRNVAATWSAAARGIGERMGAETETSSARMNKQLELMVGELRSMAESSRATGAEAFGSLAERVGSAAAGFEATAAKVANALGQAATDTGGAFGKGAEAAVGRIADATEAMKAMMDGMLQQFGQAAENAGQHLRLAGAEGAEGLKIRLDRAGNAAAQAIEGAAGKLSEAGDGAGRALRTGGEAAGTRLEGAVAGFGGHADGLARQVAAITVAAAAAAQRIGEFEQAARAATEPLTLTAADLKAAGAAARASVEPLADAGKKIGAAMEQLGGYAVRMDGLQVTSQRLATSLDDAAKRFAGVDVALANTLSALQTGLQGFSKQVAEVVGTTDRNLAQAAQQLASAIASLEDVLDRTTLMMRPTNSVPTSGSSNVPR